MDGQVSGGDSRVASGALEVAEGGAGAVVSPHISCYVCLQRLPPAPASEGRPEGSLGNLGPGPKVATCWNVT